MFHVVLDPGHARGSDKHGCNGFSEEVHNLAIANALKAKLESVGITVAMTRSDETHDPSLTQRGLAAAGADILFCMHTNGAHGTARGVTVFVSVDLPADKVPGKELAEAIAAGLGIPCRGVTTRASENYHSKPDPSTLEDYYTVIDVAQDHGCKHIFLSESGFHDNPQDWAAMHTPQGINAIAEAHARVGCKLLGVSYPAAPEPSRGGDRPTTPPIPAIPATVHEGDKGDTVKRLQLLLNQYNARLGVTLIVDGVFGPKTDAAVRAYQKVHGLQVDGIVGPQTWGALLS